MFTLILLKVQVWLGPFWLRFITLFCLGFSLTFGFALKPWWTLAFLAALGLMRAVEPPQTQFPATSPSH